MFFARIHVLFAVLSAVLFGVPSLAAEPTPEDILRHLRAREEGLENLALTARWWEYEHGTLVGTEVQTIHMDALGRIRVQHEHGAPGSPLRKLDDLYDGELTVNFVDDPNRNRLGEPQTDATKAEGERYVAAIIHDGLHRGGPRRHRNPFTFFDVSGDLSRTLAGGGEVDVEPEGSLIKLECRLAPEDDPYRIQHRILIDSAKGWAVTSHEQYYPDGRLAARKTCEELTHSNGIWVPVRGDRKSWSVNGSETPSREWRFSVESVKANDPNFDESVFEVALPPGTYVSDTRFHQSYTIGSESASSDALTELGQQAVAEQEEQRQRLEQQHYEMAGGSHWLRYTLIALSVLVVGAAIAVWVWRKI